MQPLSRRLILSLPAFGYLPGVVPCFVSGLVPGPASAQAAYPTRPISLVVPWALGIAPFLTPVAGVCVALLMGGAVSTHMRRKEPMLVPAVLAALALSVAVGRFLVA